MPCTVHTYCYCVLDLLCDSRTRFVYLFFPSTQVRIVHEPEDELEDGQRLVVVALLRLGQERGLDGLPFHLPQVRLEVDVGPL